MLDGIVSIVDAGLWWWLAGTIISLVLMVIFFLIGQGDEEEGKEEKRGWLVLANCFGPLISIFGAIFVWSAVINFSWEILI